jgi:hypothetical protein
MEPGIQGVRSGSGCQVDHDRMRMSNRRETCGILWHSTNRNVRCAGAILTGHGAPPRIAARLANDRRISARGGELRPGRKK